MSSIRHPSLIPENHGFSLDSRKGQPAPEFLGLGRNAYIVVTDLKEFLSFVERQHEIVVESKADEALRNSKPVPV